jgi:hypothetical protein
VIFIEAVVGINGLQLEISQWTSGGESGNWLFRVRDNAFMWREMEVERDQYSLTKEKTAVSMAGDAEWRENTG